MSEPAKKVLTDCLRARLDDPQITWLDNQLDELRSDPKDTNLHIALGMAPRRLGKADLLAAAPLQQAADVAVAGWRLTGWSVPDAARVLFIATIRDACGDDAAAFVSRFKSLCQTADVAEAVSLYRGLPVYGFDRELEDQVAEGLRTNMKAVFEAISHHNPYPQSVFDEHRWNHMVLKALFVDSRLAPIQGLDERTNEALSRIMRDFAHERWAAERLVPFEIWRCVGPYSTEDDAFADLQRAFEGDDLLGQQGAALALSVSTHQKAAQLLDSNTVLAGNIKDGSLTWQALD